MLQNQTANILIAEDDDDHYFLIDKILKESKGPAGLFRVSDGEELMDYLLRRGPFSDAKLYPRPHLIILDINMPKKDGWEALKEMKSHAQLRQIPVVVMTTSDIDEDIFRSYDLGANSYLRKPVELKKWVETIQIFNRYWFGAVDLPVGSASRE